jgi:Trypsin-like peptidase domain
MAFQRRQIDLALSRIRSLIPPGTDEKDYLRDCLDAHIEALSPQAPMGIVPPSLLSATQVIASARVTVERFDSPEEIAARPEGIVDLGTIEWVLRPALPISNVGIKMPSGPPWNTINQRPIAELSRAVCRLDILIKGYESRHVGTGFLIGGPELGRFLVMTNRHVTEAATKLGWCKYDEVELVCDFERFSTTLGGSLFPILPENLDRNHEEYDLSLLSLEVDFGDDCQWTEALHAASVAPNPEEGLKIGVIGHPSFDSAQDPFPKYFGFGEEFGVKRFSPGYIRALQNRAWEGKEVDVFLHDATTLSGSSGSCIIDLTTNNVVGLHFGGWPLPPHAIKVSGGKDMIARLFEANGAVPLWRLVDDPMFRGVRFH